MKSKSKKSLKVAVRKARRHDTPRAETIIPPSRHREGILPLADIGSVDFERICASLLRKSFPDVTRVALKRTRGQAQFGVDVEGFDELQNPVVVLSAKCYKNIKGWEFREWIQDFLDHVDDHWSNKGLKYFIVAVTVEANDDDMNEAARTLAHTLNEKGMKVRIWDTVEMSELLREEPGLVDRYFHQYWVDALSAQTTPGTSEEFTTQQFAPEGLSGKGPLLAQIEALYSEPLNDALSVGLETAIAELRKGRAGPVGNWLDGARSSNVAWQAITRPVRAKGIRAVAMVALGRGDLERCGELLDEADELDAAPDRSARALYVRARGGLKKALEFLASPTDRRERELMAGLLVEDGDPAAALLVLSPLFGGDVSAEVLRLRAIATYLSGGERDVALNLAKSAAVKEPGSAAATLTLGAMRIACALARGTTPQFGNIPNPVNRSLVLSNGHARSLLSQATSDFDHLLLTVQGELRREVEVWKLAALLLNPDTRSNGRLFARSLLARNDVDPAVVAWCLQNGLPIRRGKLRKNFIDRLRSGNGTPGHVAVLALIEAESKGSKGGAAVIERFGHLFPDASEFMNHWRSQFALADLPGSDFATTVRYAVQTEDVRPLLALLATEEAGIEEVLAAAEFLAGRDKFAELDGLRDRLTAIGSTRATELAAVAAVNVGDAQGALILLDDARRSGVETSGRLTRVRLKAREVLGDHPELIKELRSLLEEREDPEFRDALLSAYIRIGDLDEVAAQAEIALRSDAIDQQKALQIAYVLRRHAPETARRALEMVQKEPLPDKLAGAVLNLSSELGLTQLQDEMLRKLVADPTGDQVLYRFDSVEDILAMVNERAAEYRSRLDQWMHGRLPAAAAMAQDPKDYALLLLGSQATRENRMGEAIPMMLCSPVSSTPLDQPELPTNFADSILRIDMGALLTADRFGLLERLERCFKIEVPRSLPEALIEVGATLFAPSHAGADAIRSIQYGESAIRIIDDEAQGALELVTVRDAMEDADKAALTYAAQEAYRGGHVTSTQLEQLLLRVGLNDDEPLQPIELLLLSGGAVVEMAELGILESIARGFPIRMRRQELRNALRRIDVLEDEERVKRRLARLSGILAGKLSTGKWKTIAESRNREELGMRDQMPPHLRCVLETLPRDEDASTALFWIEDRTVSRRPLPNAMTLPMLVSRLMKCAQMDSKESAALAKSLRSAGYLFLPIDVDEILETIQSAHIEGQVLVENSDLGDLRRWFANDVLNLKYLDQQMQIDGQGRIVGEVRRTLDLAALTTTVLERVWSSSSSNVKRKIGLSAWIWSNLRMAYVPTPPAADVPEARRHIGVLTAVQALCVPIHAELATFGSTSAWRKSFMNWIIEAIVEPTAEADKEAGDGIVEMTALLLTKASEVPTDTPDEIQAALGRRLRGIVSDFLNLVPEPWATRIGDRRGLRETLGRQTIGILQIGEKDHVAIGDLERAIERALADESGRSEVEVQSSENRAIVVLSEDVDGFPGASISMQGREVLLDNTTFALVDPRADIREGLLCLFAPEEGVQRPLTRDLLSAIARDPDVEARFTRYRTALESDFNLSRELMWQRVSSGGSIQISDFDLPPAGVLLNFLGLPADFNGGGMELLLAAWPILKGWLGADQAVYRLSSLPLRLPDDVLGEFVESIGNEALQRGWLADFGSAMYSFARLFALARTQIPDDDAELLDSVSAERVQLLVTMVRHCTAQAVHDEAWCSLPPELALCLIWVHADQKIRDVSVEGMDFSTFNKWLSSKTNWRLMDNERARIWQKWITNCSSKLSVDRVHAALLGELLRLKAKVPENLKSLLSSSQENWIPHPEVLAPRPQAPMEFWIGSDPTPLFVEAEWLPRDFIFAERDPSKLIGALLDEFGQADPFEFAAVIALAIDVQSLNKTSLERLRDKLDTVAEFESGTAGGGEHDAYLDLFAKVCRQQGDQGGLERLIQMAAQSYSKTWSRIGQRLSNRDEGEGAALGLVNAAFGYALSGDDEFGNRMALITKFLKIIADNWSGTNLAILSCLDSLTDQIDIPTASEHLLPTLLQLRAR